MSQPNKKPGIDASLVAPALVMGMLYGIFVILRGLPGSAELTAKQRAFQDAQAAAVEPSEVLRLTKESEELTGKLASMRTELGQTRLEGESLARKESKPLGRIDVVAQIEEILKKRGLEVTKVKAAAGATENKMAATLQKAAGSLVAVLSKSRPAADLLQSLSIENRIAAEQQALTGGPVSQAPPPLDLREMEVRGEYHEMLAALWDLSSGAGESVVVSLGLERPLQTGKVRDPLIWKLIVHVQPGSGYTPSTIPPLPRTPKPERLASDKRE